MASRVPVPIALRIVAWLQLFTGISAGTAFFCDGRLGGTPLLAIRALGLPASFGLMHRQNGWRICVLVLLGIDFLMLTLELVSGCPGESILGLAPNLREAQNWPVLATYAAFLLGQAFVITRPGVRRWFMPPSETDDSHRDRRS